MSRETYRKKKGGTGTGLLEKKQKLNWVLKRKTGFSHPEKGVPARRKEGWRADRKRLPTFAGPCVTCRSLYTLLGVQSRDGEASQRAVNGALPLEEQASQQGKG